MERCKICIMPNTAKGIILDENGVCQLCRNFKPPKRKGYDELEKIIHEHLNSTNKYNCIVPVSGGRDSSYALYFAKEKLKLNPIAVHNDNDFETEIANTNLKTITTNLNVPLKRLSSKKRISKKIVAEKFKMNAHFGPWLAVAQACEACEYGFKSGAYRVARENNIRLILWGDSVEESTTPYHDLNRRKIPTKFDRILSPGIINLLKYKYYFNKMKKEYGPDTPGNLEEIHLYDYIEWDRETIVNTIQNKLGWSKPKESATSWRIDCHLVPIVNVLTEKAYGVSKIEIGFSNMIRGGKMNREDALKQVENIQNNIEMDEFKKFMKDLKLSDKCIKKMIG